MTAEQTGKFITWLEGILLAFEDFFHKIQEWFDNDSWMQRIVNGDETTEA